MMRNLERRTLWSQRKKRTCFLTRSIVRKSVVDHINRSRMESTDLISAVSIFDPRHLQTEDKLADYGIEKIRTLSNFYSVAQRIQFQGEPDINAEDTESE